jgi:hypothetical protein
MDDANKFLTAVSRSVGKPYGIQPRTRVIPAHISQMQAERPDLHTLSSATTPAFDAGARAAGNTFLPSGTPRRYGKYFGIKSPGSSNY